jgi:hypothetical protein
LLCLFALISQGWAMDDDQMSQLMVGSWQASGQEQMPSGTWKIERGNLFTHLEQVDPPNFASLFSDSSKAIQFIDDNTWKFVDGSVGVAHRLR